MRRRSYLLAALAALTAVLLSGCGSGSGGGTTSERMTQHAATRRPVDRLRVGLTEWQIDVSAGRVTPGTVRMLVTNAGSTTHDLYVRGRRGTWHTRDLPPGGHQRLVVRTVPREGLHLWCSLPGHAAQGMRTTLPVATATSSTTPGSTTPGSP